MYASAVSAIACGVPEPVVSADLVIHSSHLVALGSVRAHLKLVGLTQSMVWIFLQSPVGQQTAPIRTSVLIVELVGMLAELTVGHALDAHQRNRH